MILHLESGACDSKIDIFDLNKSAAICYQWRAYLDEEYQHMLIDRRELSFEYNGTVYFFKCPECNNVFTKVSGLFQHVYSRACN